MYIYISMLIHQNYMDAVGIHKTVLYRIVLTMTARLRKSTENKPSNSEEDTTHQKQQSHMKIMTRYQPSNSKLKPELANFGAVVYFCFFWNGRVLIRSRVAQEWETRVKDFFN